jgi:3-dehydroquinate dehydratase-1
MAFGMKRLVIPQTTQALRVGCITTPAGLRLLKKKLVGAVEVRVDALLKKRVSVKKIQDALSSRKSPVILTLRAEDEGGVYKWRHGERVKVLNELWVFADAVDIELAHVQEFKSFLPKLRSSRIRIILSAHSIRKPYTPRALKRLMANFRKQRADFYKIAGLATTQAQLVMLAEPLFQQPKLPMAVMAVGPLAPVSRLVLPAMGSRLLYGYLDRPAAPNQPSIEALDQLLEKLGL